MRRCVLLLKGVDYRTRVYGLPVHVETRRGRVRRGREPDGTPWRTEMEVPYGYFAGVQGLDSGELDVFVGPDKTAPDVYLITTMKWPDYTEQDETKVMAQFASASAARHCFNHHYDNPRAFGWMVRMPVAVFQEKIRLARENGERL